MSLPAHVYAVKDRHGRTRYRYIRKGAERSPYLPGPPGSAQFKAAYQLCVSGDPIPPRAPPPLRKYKGTELVYFVGPVDGPIKIGTTCDIELRISRLQTGCPAPLKVFALVEGGASLEAEYHMRFATHRMHGEWFEFCAAIQDEISRLGGGCFQPEISNLDLAGKYEGTSDA